MKKFITMVMACLIACLSIVSVATIDQPAKATGSEPIKIDFANDVVEMMPKTVTFGAKKYYLINDEKEINGAGGVAIEEKPEHSIAKWKWVCRNVDKIETNAVVLIENDLDFTNYNNLLSLSYKNILKEDGNPMLPNGEIPINFDVIGGKAVFSNIDSKKVERIEEGIAPVIKNFDLTDTKQTSFIESVNGTTVKRLHFVNCDYNFVDPQGYLGGLVGTMINGTLSQIDFEDCTITVKGKIESKMDGQEEVVINGENKVVVGGIVGKVVDGMISNCNFEGTIKASESEKTVTGKTQKTTEITNVESTNSIVGGLVGEIVMGGANAVNKVDIANNYFVGKLFAGKYVAGIIGNIDFKHYSYDKTAPIANIKTVNVFAKIFEIQSNTCVEYGILGNIVAKSQEEVLPGPITPVDPANPVDPNALNLTKVTFANVISTSTYVKVAQASEPVTPADNAIALKQGPKEILQAQITNGTTVGNSEFSKAQTYNGFDLNAWILQESVAENIRHLDLKYKFDRDKVIANIVGEVKSSSTIVERNSKGEVFFIAGEPIVMSLNEADGIYVNRIYVEFTPNGGEPIQVELYKAKQSYMDADRYTSKQAFFNHYSVKKYFDEQNTLPYLEYDYENSKLVITPKDVEVLGDIEKQYLIFDESLQTPDKYRNIFDEKYENVEFKFEFTESVNGKTKLTANNYRVSPKAYVMNPTYTDELTQIFTKDNNDEKIYYQSAEGFMVKTYPIDYEFDTTKPLTFYIDSSAYNDYLLDRIIVSSKIDETTGSADLNRADNEEILENKTDKGWMFIKNKMVYQTDDGKIVDKDTPGAKLHIYLQYEVRLNFLHKKLYNFENLDIKFIFKGRKIDIRISDDNRVNLQHHDYINATYQNMEGEQIVGEPQIGDKVKLQVNLTEYGKQVGYVFNLLYQESPTAKAQNIIKVLDKDKNVVNYEVEFDINGVFTTKDYIPITNGMEIIVSTVQSREVNIKQENGLINPPSMQIAKIPVFDAKNTHIIGALDGNLYYKYDSVKKNSIILTDSPAVFYSKTNGNAPLEEYKIDGKLITVGGNQLYIIPGNQVSFRTVAIDHTIKIIDYVVPDADGNTVEVDPNTYYPTLNSYTIDGAYVKIANQAGETDKSQGELKLADYSRRTMNIVVAFNVVKKNVTISYKVQEGEGADITDSPLADTVQKSVVLQEKYGTNVSLSRVSYYDAMSSLAADYKFVGWKVGDKLITEESIDFDVLGDKEVSVVVKKYKKMQATSLDNEAGKIFYNGREVVGDNKVIKFVKGDFEQIVYIIKTSSKYNLSIVGDIANCCTIDASDPAIVRLTVDVNKLLSDASFKDNDLYNIDVNFEVKPFDISVFKVVGNEAGDVIGTNPDGSAIEVGGEVKIISSNDIDTKLYEVAQLFKNTFELSDLQSLAKVPNIHYGDKITIEVTIPSNYTVIWYKYDGIIPELILDSDIIRKPSIAGKEKQQYVLSDITQNDIICVKYIKAESLQTYTIADPVVAVGTIGKQEGTNNEIFESLLDTNGNPIISLSSAIINYDFDNSNATLTRVPIGTQVTFSYQILNNKYDFFGWENTYIDADGNEHKVVVRAPVNRFDMAYNYKSIKLLLVEKTFDLTLTLPNRDGIEVTIVTIPKADGVQDKYVSSATDTSKNTISFKLKYGTAVVIGFPNSEANKGYDLDHWTGPDYYAHTENFYSISMVDGNVNVGLKVVPKVTIDDIIQKDLKVTHHMLYGKDVKTGTTDAVLTNGNKNVILKAIPSKGAKFVRWIKNGNREDNFEGYDSATITVENKEDLYEAEFAIQICNVNIDDANGLISITGGKDFEYGNDVTFKLWVPEGYVIDKVIVDGTKEIQLGNIKEFTLYGIDGDKDVKVVYRKVGMTKSDKDLIKVAVILLVITVIFAFIVRRSVMKSIKKTQTAKKNKKIKINID